jgi:YVTN family beta-propeller protein
VTEGVFVSYRRDDAPGHAGRLYDSLVSRFGADRVFMDVDSIDPGVDFVELIEATLANSTVVVVVIGPGWLNAHDASGADRLGQTDDFVHMEVRRALELDKRVIPVLVDGARPPAPAELPADLAVLARRNAFDISDARFHSDAERLADAIEKLLVPGPTAVMPAVETVAGANVESEPAAPDQRVPERAAQRATEQPRVVVGSVRRRRWLVPAAAIAAVVLVIALIAGLMASRGGETGNETDATDAVTEPNATDTSAGTGEASGPAVPAAVQTIATGTHPVEAEVVDDTLWVQVDGGLESYGASGDDPTPTDSIDLGSNGNDIVPGDGVLYVTLGAAAEVAVVDLSTNEVDRISVPGDPLSGTLLDDTLWVTAHGDFDGAPGALVPVADGTAGTPIPLDEKPYAVLAYADALWVTFADTDQIAYVDPTTGDVTPYTVGPNPVDVQAVNDQLWVTLSGANQVAVVDPDNGEVVDQVDVGTRPWKLAEGFDAVWVSNRGDDVGPGSVSRIDPSSLEVTGNVPTEVSTDELAIGPTAVFAVNNGSNTVSVISPGTSS